MPAILCVTHEFDSTTWRTVPSGSAGSVLLLTWNVSPPPADAGMPECVALVFGRALCSLGTVIYAGDRQGEGSRYADEVPVRRGIRSLKLTLFHAETGMQVLPAFTNTTHDWSMNAQWLMIVDSSIMRESYKTTLKRLYQDWKLPECWPSNVEMIVQAAVDGDGAACYSANHAVEDSFLENLRKCAQLANIELVFS